MANPRLEPFANALRGRMAERGISVQALADELGVTRQTVSAWRNAANEPSVRSVAQIERILGSPRGELIELLAPEGDEGESHDATDTSSELAPFGEYEALSDDEKRQVQEFARYLLSRHDER